MARDFINQEKRYENGKPVISGVNSIENKKESRIPSRKFYAYK